MSKKNGHLRERLVGAWGLVSYVERPVRGGEDRHPLGVEPQGIIMYTPDGYMSAQLMRPGRPPYASGDWFEASDAEAQEIASGYIAYSGPFRVASDGTLTHSMSVSLYPNWLGQTQPRIVELDGDTLRLSTASPIRSGGIEVNSYLTWRRLLPGS